MASFGPGTGTAQISIWTTTAIASTAASNA
jgi:hypothetical protein